MRPCGNSKAIRKVLVYTRSLPTKGSRQLLDTTLKARSSTARSTKSMDSLHMKRKEPMGLKLHFAMRLTTTLTLAKNLA